VREDGCKTTDTSDCGYEWDVSKIPEASPQKPTATRSIMDIPQPEGRDLGGEEEVVGDVWALLGQPHGLARPKEARRSDFLRQLILIFAAASVRPASCLVAARTRRVRLARVSSEANEDLGEYASLRVGGDVKVSDAAVQQNQAI
jgi:hypothetical protein